MSHRGEFCLLMIVRIDVKFDVKIEIAADNKD
jgi:hypothetical protein